MVGSGELQWKLGVRKELGAERSQVRKESKQWNDKAVKCRPQWISVCVNGQSLHGKQSNKTEGSKKLYS